MQYWVCRLLWEWCPDCLGHCLCLGKCILRKLHVFIQGGVWGESQETQSPRGRSLGSKIKSEEAAFLLWNVYTRQLSPPYQYHFTGQTQRPREQESLSWVTRVELGQNPVKKERKKVKSPSRVWLFATPWTVAYQAPLSMGFSRQEYWSGLPFPSPRDRPNPGIKQTK